MLDPTTDNNCGNFHVPNEHRENLLAIGNKNINALCKDNPGMLVFPQSLGQYHDGIEHPQIFSLLDNTLTTCNIMGFVGRNNTQLTITSRFAKDDKHDYFLHYMLQKVFSVNLLKFDQTSDKENIWDFLLYLFPHYLKKAYSQGLYKAYKREEYNDANVKGAIDVKRHIRINIPFYGKIAYTTREHSHDNAVTQLIRHTIEHIKTHPFGCGVLASDSEIRDIVSKFCFLTQNSYNRNARQKIISLNLKSVSHPYYTEYKMLQKICLRILRREQLTFGAEKDKIYGLLFDGAWLWEEYLNKVFIEQKLDFTHAENKTGKCPIYLFEGDKYERFPDFYKNNIVLDAKYKRLDSKNMDRDDLHQIISYMYVRQAKIGGFVYPSDTQNTTKPIGILNGYGGNVYKWGIQIPQKTKDFLDFQNKARESEQITGKSINEIKILRAEACPSCANENIEPDAAIVVSETFIPTKIEP